MLFHSSSDFVSQHSRTYLSVSLFFSRLYLPQKGKMGYSALSMAPNRHRHIIPVLAILHLCLHSASSSFQPPPPSTAPPLLATIDAWFANARNTTPYALAPGIAGVVILGGKAHTFGDGVQVRREEEGAHTALCHLQVCLRYPGLDSRVCLGCRVFLNGDGVSRDPRVQSAPGFQESEGSISCDWVFY